MYNNWNERGKAVGLIISLPLCRANISSGIICIVVFIYNI